MLHWFVTASSPTYKGNKKFMLHPQDVINFKAWKNIVVPLFCRTILKTEFSLSLVGMFHPDITVVIAKNGGKFYEINFY